MPIDLAGMQDKLAAVLAKELDDALPEGVAERVVAEVLKLVGETLLEAGKALEQK